MQFLPCTSFALAGWPETKKEQKYGVAVTSPQALYNAIQKVSVMHKRWPVCMQCLFGIWLEYSNCPIRRSYLSLTYVYICMYCSYRSVPNKSTILPAILAICIGKSVCLESHLVERVVQLYLEHVLVSKVLSKIKPTVLGIYAVHVNRSAYAKYLPRLYSTYADVTKSKL